MAIKHIILISLCAVFVSCSGISIIPKKSLTITDIQQNPKASLSYILLDESSEKMKGLSGRSDMDQDEGALFLLSKSDGAFWMKDMKFALDILFFDENNRLTTILWNVQPCTEGQYCPAYKVPSKAKYALEINSGALKDSSITTGDLISLQ